MSKQTIEEMALDLNAKFQFLIDSQAETLEKLSALPVWVFSVQNHHNQEMDFSALGFSNAYLRQLSNLTNTFNKNAS